MKTTGADTQGGGKLLYPKPYLTSCDLLRGVQASLSGTGRVESEKKRNSEKRTVRDRTDCKHGREKDSESDN